MEVIFSIKLFVCQTIFHQNDLFIKLFPGPIFPSANIQVWGGRHSTSICTQVTVAKLRLMRWKQRLQNDYSWKGEKEAACPSRGWWSATGITVYYPVARIQQSVSQPRNIFLIKLWIMFPQNFLMYWHLLLLSCHWVSEQSNIFLINLYYPFP